MHTVVNASSVPIDTSSPRIVTGNRPAITAASVPVISVPTYGVLCVGCTLRKNFGNSPSTDIA